MRIDNIGAIEMKASVGRIVGLMGCAELRPDLEVVILHFMEMTYS